MLRRPLPYRIALRRCYRPVASTSSTAVRSGRLRTSQGRMGGPFGPVQRTAKKAVVGSAICLRQLPVSASVIPPREREKGQSGQGPRVLETVQDFLHYRPTCRMKTQAGTIATRRGPHQRLTLKKTYRGDTANR
ncbi:hypothetical protein CH63R_09889 [Colletotrichum higginsianum IMI 349063]|uniref:Uncharacterized protein n=1 Tax=Colletotrichum higginsianum (strain IMI 349063) TaxID=759273 RepID=A0A1B7Y178_COLHI|nr:uncharacterized protein CH63R_09889 [Colletotrichum higginsianum IMI 349063]OBR05769.1 hypothetical protein CH63R_09889 [Colletotrichum higginsianum IMI 349063]